MNLTTHDIDQAAQRLKNVLQPTPLQYSKRLSDKYQATIYLKREDQTDVRSFKLRGAYNKMSSLKEEEKKRGVVCASAGNHAQGVALSCSLLKIKGTIFMPVVTPTQKINKVRGFGGPFVEVQLVGDTFDDASNAAQDYCKEQNAVYVHPFDDPLTIAGQGTVGKEIWEELTWPAACPLFLKERDSTSTFQKRRQVFDTGVSQSRGESKPVGGVLDLVLCTVGGGGLLSGVASYLKNMNPEIQLYGVEPEGAAGMKASLSAGKVVSLEKIDTFVDGAAVRRVGDNTFQIVRELGIPIITVPEGQACSTMIELYQNEGIVTEPAGILPISALDYLNVETQDVASLPLGDQSLKGKTVVCIISGSNNDLLRYPEILERSLIYQGRKHYFIINFTQKPGQLKKLVAEVLGPNDDIVRFEYIKKTNAEKGPAFVGIELSNKEDLQPLLKRLHGSGLEYQKVESDELLYKYLV